MKIEFHRNFVRNYKKRYGHNPKIQKKFKERVRVFSQNPNHPFLRDHALVGKKLGLRAFAVTGDIRVVYYLKNETVFFLDIGIHNQVY